MAKYGHRPINWFEDIVNRMGGEERAERFRRGELVLVELERKWYEQEGVITFSVTTNGMTGEQWIAHVEKKGVKLSSYARSILLSPDFKLGSIGETRHNLFGEQLQGIHDLFSVKAAVVDEEYQVFHTVIP